MTPPAIEADIMSRLINVDEPSFSPEAARGILSLQFSEDDKRRMRELSEKARQGTLSGGEQTEAEGYARVGSLVGLLHSKARRALSKSDQATANV
jgi:hypothetical protein